MKKIIFILLFFMTFSLSVKAESQFYVEGKVPDMYITVYDDENFYNGSPSIIKQIGDGVVYSSNPYLEVNTENFYTEYNYNDIVFNLNDTDLDLINVISHYGYNYGNHTDIKWYGITQYLIWNVVNPTNIYMTDENGNGTNMYSDEIAELQSLVTNHYKKPNFSGFYVYDTNSNYVIEDSNEALNNFEIVSSDLDAVIIDNALNISTNEVGDYEINLIKKDLGDIPNLLYYLENSQSLIKPGKFNEIKVDIAIIVMRGSISITKRDSENKYRPNATFEGSLYGVYDENNIVATIEINKDGYGYVDNLKLGKYYIKELRPSNGYTLNDTVYEINVIDKQPSVELILYSKIIKANVLINKYYGSSNNYKLEDGAIFELYDNNDNLINTYETINGIAFAKLEYGNYYLIQIKGKEGYKFVDRVDISITEEKDYVIDLYNEEKKGFLRIFKYYGCDNEYQLEDGAAFEVYNDKNILIGTYETVNGQVDIELDNGYYNVYQIKGKEGYSISSGFDILIENGEGYSYTIYDERIKSYLVINKYYGYDGIYQNEYDAEFELYDSNDNLLKIYNTNSGQIFDTLEYGDYYLIQTKGKEGYKFVDRVDIQVRDNFGYVFDLYNEAIQVNLIVNKYYGNSDGYELEDGAAFELYDIYNNLIGIYETINGVISTTLSYDDYYLIQTNGKEGYKFVDRIDINICEEKDYVIDLYNEQMQGNLIINKYYGNFDNYELEDGAAFELYDIYNNLIGIYETINGVISTILSYGDYYLIQTNGKEGYKFVDRVDIQVRDNFGYVFDLYNEAIQVNLIVNKYYGNSDGYELEDGAVFELYDIYNNLIGIYETVNGVISMTIPYGEYYLIQVKGKEGYKFVDRVDINITEEKDYVLNLYNEQEVLIVEVPDTLKNNYNKYISRLLILIGILIITIEKISIIKKNY